MIDPELRLPNTHFRAVFNLGGSDSFLTAPELPELALTMELSEDEGTLWVYADAEEGAIHVGYSGEGPVEHHFHRASDGEATERALWGKRRTALIVEWMAQLTVRVYALMPDMYADVLEAAAWHDQGYHLYVCESEPAELELIDVELEGEVMTLPWLGSGSVDNMHVDGDNHPIELLWNAHGLEPDVPIARAWLNPNTEHPDAVGLPGVDWQQVGLSQSDTAEWLEGVYLNHHVIADPVDALFDAILRRIGGLDS